MVHLVAMDEAAAASAARGEAFGQHFQDRVEVLAREIAVWPRAPDHGIEVVLTPVVARGLGHDLLREHVEGRIERDQTIELAAPHRGHQRRAFDQVVAGFGEHAALRRAMNRVAGAADALQERADSPR